jgi:ABC-2 type transport system ATP-binding protein
MSAPVVAAEHLSKRFGDFTAVDNVSFELAQGEILGYLGPNGSGKTTTLRMLLGLLRPSSGRAELFGQDVTRAGDALRARVGYMSQRSALYDELTVSENLWFYAQAYGVRQAERIRELLQDLGLEAVAKSRVGEVPIGWRQRLALAGALVHRPPLLILDEPTSGVDPVSRRSFWDRIYGLAEQGVAILVTTHYMEEAEYCHRVGIMIDGALRAIDEPAGLKHHALPGAAWDVWAQPALEALEALEAEPGVSRAGLAGDHLRAITRPGVEATDLILRLRAKGFAGVRIEPVDPTLEDVFLALAGESPAGSDLVGDQPPL